MKVKHSKPSHRLVFHNGPITFWKEMEVSKPSCFRSSASWMLTVMATVVATVMVGYDWLMMNELNWVDSWSCGWMKVFTIDCDDCRGGEWVVRGWLTSSCINDNHCTRTNDSTRIEPAWDINSWSCSDTDSQGLQDHDYEYYVLKNREPFSNMIFGYTQRSSAHTITHPYLSIPGLESKRLLRTS